MSGVPTMSVLVAVVILAGVPASRGSWIGSPFGPQGFLSSLVHKPVGSSSGGGLSALVSYSMAQKISKQEVQISVLKGLLVNAENRADEFEERLEQLQQTQEDQATMIQMIKDSLPVPEPEPQQVGFTVSITQEQDAVGGSLVDFGQSTYNEGNGFDLTTDVFTAPCDGLYYFYFSIEPRPNAASNQLNLEIAVNGNVVAAGPFAGQNGREILTTGATVLLDAQDEVGVTFSQSTGELDNDDMEGTFTGFKILGDC